MYPKAAVDVSMLVPFISHAQIPNPVKCKMPLQSPTFSRFQPKNHPLDSTKTLIFLASGAVVRLPSKTFRGCGHPGTAAGPRGQTQHYPRGQIVGSGGSALSDDRGVNNLIQDRSCLCPQKIIDIIALFSQFHGRAPARARPRPTGPGGQGHDQTAGAAGAGSAPKNAPVTTPLWPLWPLGPRGMGRDLLISPPPSGFGISTRRTGFGS